MFTSIRRCADWDERGFTEALTTFASLNARSKFWGDDQRAAFKNWEQVADPRNPLGGRQGVDERIMLRELVRRVDMMVILENKLDALVRLHTPWPPGLIGHPHQYDIPTNLTPESLSGPNAGLTEVLIPAGYVTTVYDPVFALNADATRYISRPSHTPTTVPEPGLPFSLVMRVEPGKEDILLKIASAYEAASRRRIPPPDFGRLPPGQRRHDSGAGGFQPTDGEENPSRSKILSAIRVQRMPPHGNASTKAEASRSLRAWCSRRRARSNPVFTAA